MPAWRTGYCYQCTTSLSCSEITTIGPGTCPVCYDDHDTLCSVPSGCSHGVCTECYRSLYLGPPLPTGNGPAYADAVVDWFNARPLNWEKLSCPMCRAAPNPITRLNTMVERSMYAATEITSINNLPSRIMAVNLIKQVPAAQ
jgi:hypothetical protein